MEVQEEGSSSSVVRRRGESGGNRAPFKMTGLVEKAKQKVEDGSSMDEINNRSGVPEGFGQQKGDGDGYNDVDPESEESGENDDTSEQFIGEAGKKDDNGDSEPEDLNGEETSNPAKYSAFGEGGPPYLPKEVTEEVKDSLAPTQLIDPIVVPATPTASVESYETSIQVNREGNNGGEAEEGSDAVDTKDVAEKRDFQGMKNEKRGKHQKHKDEDGQDLEADEPKDGANIVEEEQDATVGDTQIEEESDEMNESNSHFTDENGDIGSEGNDQSEDSSSKTGPVVESVSLKNSRTKEDKKAPYEPDESPEAPCKEAKSISASVRCKTTAMIKYHTFVFLAGSALIVAFLYLRRKRRASASRRRRFGSKNQEYSRIIAEYDDLEGTFDDDMASYNDDNETMSTWSDGPTSGLELPSFHNDERLGMEEMNG